MPVTPGRAANGRKRMLLLATITDPIVRFALWTGAGATILTAGVFMQIMYLRFALLRKARREQAFLALWRPILVPLLLGQPIAQLPPLAQSDQVLFLKLWVQLLESVRSGSSGALPEVASRIGCAAIAMRLLEHGSRPEQMLATIALGHLHESRAWSMLLVCAQDADASRAFASMRALVQIDAARAAPLLVPMLVGRADWPIARIAPILYAERMHFGEPLFAACARLEGEALIKALRLTEALRLQVPPALLRAWLCGDQRPELLVAALRNSAIPQLLPLVRALLGHADWRVRVQGAKVLGRIGERGDEHLLIALLGDAQWWVRYRAAQSLCGLPFFDRTALAALRQSSPDRFARDMLAQVLTEGGAA